MRALGASPLGRASAAYFALFVAVGAASPYLPVYYRAIGLDLGTIGLILALSAAIQLVTAPLWGTLADTFPRSRWPLPVAAGLAAAAAGALSQAQELPAIVACVALLAAGLSGVLPILDARTIDLVGPDRNRYGRVRAVGSFSFVVAAIGVGLLLEGHGEPALFIVYVPALIATMLAAATLPRSGGARSSVGLRGAWILLRRRDVTLFLLGALFTWSAVSAVNGFYSIQLISLRAPPPAVGFAWAVGAIVEVPLMWTFPRLAQRFGTERLLIAGACGFAVRTATYAVLRDPALLIAANAMSGFSYALLLTGGVTFVSRRVPAALAATGQGLHSSMIALAAILGSSLGGLGAAALTIPGLYAAAAGVCVAAAGIVAFAVRSDRRAVLAPGAVGSAAVHGEAMAFGPSDFEEGIP